MTKCVFITRRLPEGLIEPLRAWAEVKMWPEERTPVPSDVLVEAAKEADAMLTLITDRIDEAVLSSGKRLRLIANMAVGYNNIDVALAKTKGVLITHTPDVLTETTADLAFALILSAARRLPAASKALYEGRWGPWSPFDFVGRDVYGSTLGIWGMGRIGKAVASRARGFEMNILYHNRRRLDPQEEARYGATYVDFKTLFATSDVVLVLVPYDASLHHAVDRNVLQSMKKDSILVVASRGGLVDEKALYDVLTSGHLYAAGLDVFEQEPLPLDHPLLQLEQVVLTPHIGSATIQTRMAMGARAVHNIIQFLKGTSPQDLIPELRLP